jgi:hypothetical protein
MGYGFLHVDPVPFLSLSPLLAPAIHDDDSDQCWWAPVRVILALVSTFIPSVPSLPCSSSSLPR